MKALWLCLGALLVSLALHQAAVAHEGRPLFIELEEKEGGALFIRWRVPATIDRSNAPRIKLPEVCGKVRPPQTNATQTGEVGQGLFDCSGLSAALTLTIDYPQGNPSVSTLVRVIRPTGEVQVIRSGPGEQLISIPDAENAGSVAQEYLVLGVEHILTGYDHLLFVACLLMLAGTVRRVLITVTGFTLAHSVTLALAALDIVRVPVPPLEAAIALSIVFVAAELARPRRDTLTWRYPILVSSGFGLLHGFGFAAVLGEIGLPQTEVPLALLFFNLGVELGQVAFILVLIGLFIVVTQVMGKLRSDFKDGAPARPVDFTIAVGYIVGALATFWLFERVAGMVA